MGQRHTSLNSRNTTLPADHTRTASSNTSHLIKDGHKNAFVGAAVLAFAKHFPLELKPDHFWLLVQQGISKHVEMHAEQLRAKFVNFHGKKELVVRADDFALGSAANDWPRVFPQFVEQIDAHTVPGVVPRLESVFSTTTPVDAIAGKITLMDVCKSFFEYTVMTMCGFPSVTLHGTRADWVQLHEKIPAALALCEPGFASSWGAALASVTEKFIKVRRACACMCVCVCMCACACVCVCARRSIELFFEILPLTGPQAFDGERDEDFWQSMVKRGGTHGSGARTWYCGWLNTFFPYGTNDGDPAYAKNQYAGLRCSICIRCCVHAPVSVCVCVCVCVSMCVFVILMVARYCVPYRPDAGYVKQGLKVCVCVWFLCCPL
jgi:hypothetical protein